MTVMSAPTSPVSSTASATGSLPESEMITWTGLAPWEFGFPFHGGLITTFLVCIWQFLVGDTNINET